MTPPDPLAGLNPLREPELIGWWPLAPGWWILIALLFTALLLALLWLARRHRANAYRRAALRQLDALAERYPQASAAYLAELNALLKAVALQVFPRQQVAAASGQAWLDFLHRSFPSGRPFAPEFAAAAYRPVTAELDREALHASAGAWIKHHRRPA